LFAFICVICAGAAFLFKKVKAGRPVSAH